MDDLAVLTPSFRGDLEFFADLHRSVLEHTDDSVIHHVVVPPSDASLFRPFEGRRCRVWTHRDLLPSGYRCIPRANGLAVKVTRPWPPVRGWVVQQLMKIEATARTDARVVLTVDSDAALIRPVTADCFLVGGETGHYRLDNAVTVDMHRHVIWHDTGRRLLGLPAGPTPPLPDYVSAMSVWSPATIRALQQRISDVSGRNWLDTVSAELHISEFVLCGLFVDHVLGRSSAQLGVLCHDYYGREPLDEQAALEFVERLPATAFGVMISSHSGTPRDVRLAAFRHGRELAASRFRSEQ